LEPCFFAEILDALGNRKDLQITFDDSNVSDYAIAFPLLQAREMPARFFITVGQVDQGGFLSTTQLRSLQAAGMRIGSHGMRHRSWTRLNDTELHEEVIEAKSRLEQICEAPVTEAACPFGAYDRRVLQKLRKAGFQRVFTSDGGSASAAAWIQPRNTILRSYNLERVMNPFAERQSTTKLVLRLLRLTLKRWR
jgi:peptidoglycan/xylan/chitin deacetylase (PgdA/CDA1 family)